MWYSLLQEMSANLGRNRLEDAVLDTFLGGRATVAVNKRILACPQLLYEGTVHYGHTTP